MSKEEFNGNFKCHRLIKFNNLICVRCTGIFHAACLKRTKGRELIDKVVCSRRCKEDMENSLFSVRSPDLNDQSVNAVRQECVGNTTIGIVEGEVSTDVSQGSSIGGQDMQGDVSPIENQHSQCPCDTNEEYWEMKLEELKNSNDELAQSLSTIERENEIRVTLLNGEIEQLKEEIL
ncbi:hypothetical protein HHI36_010099 [Cryptolaemus montrouzieri]|uniref:Phorbol-ester/DAG-type domain-containing protein n=1 Tax=Cryptolaemus montrouzieri TaxID=559131 RepID=A0ABD2MHT0_9CUCU